MNLLTIPKDSAKVAELFQSVSFFSRRAFRAGKAFLPKGLALVMPLVLTLLPSEVVRGATLVSAWGDNTSLQTQVPPGLTSVAGVAAGYQHSLALKADGTVAGWGYNLLNQATPPAGLSNVTAIAAGYSHSLALRTNGTMVGWGNQLPPNGVSNIMAIAAGWNHSLALNSNGTVIGWGSNPNVPSGLSNIVAIAAGNNFSLALRLDGTVVAWGDNIYGKSDVPEGLSEVAAIAAGGDHALALKRDGTVVGWGGDYDGQATVPAGVTNVVAIAAGGGHSLALKNDGTLAGWGNNVYGQSTVIPGQNGFFGISAGSFHSLAVKGNGAPVITVQPLSQKAFTGKDIAFQVMAAGTQPLSYQWLRNGTNIFGATNATLVAQIGLTTNVEIYTVVVANLAGSVISSPAVVTPVASAPLILAQPQDQTPICGEGASFQVNADGSRPLNYQWYYEGRSLLGATRSDLAFGVVGTNNVGRYWVVANNPFGSVTSSVARMTLVVEPTWITSPLAASGKQGRPFNYRITGLHSPSHFSASFLPPGLQVESTSGIISGIPLENGTFGPWIFAANDCASDVQQIMLTFASSVPVITSPLTATGVEEAPFNYQITANESPTSFWATSLPVGLSVNPSNGLISGRSVYAGDFDSTISASNRFGIGSATVHFSFTNAPITGLSIANVLYKYSSPYLLDFVFSLRDNDDPAQGHAVAAAPRLLSITCKEDDKPVSDTETAVIVERGSSKLIKAYLALDFTESIASLANGDGNGDGISDAIESMVSGAQAFVNQQAADAQMGVYEFHREDADPQQVIALTTDKTVLNQSIAGIWTNYVKWFPAGSRCWDTLVSAITALGPTNRDEQHFLIFVSDGQDESSTATLDAVITAATNNGVQISCVGFGSELDATTLQAITTETKGRYYEATNSADLGAQLAEIGKDIGGQYLLRWATLKRTSKAFMPSFEVNWQGLTALSPTNPVIVSTNIIPPATNPPPPVTNYIIGWYVPSQYAGNVTVGSVRLVANAEKSPKAVTLRASYVPRYIRQMRMHYRANWPCTPSLESGGVGEILSGWSLSQTDDGAGGNWLLISAAYPPSLTNSIPFGALGNLVKFTMRDMLDATNAFSLFVLDNSIYTNTGNQTFVLETTNGFFATYPVLPHVTPVPWLIAHGFTNNFPQAELSDPDFDGVPTWQEYQANTDPRNANSKFILRSLYQRSDGRFDIIVSTSSNRTYRLDSSTNLLDWDVVLDSIPGASADVILTDERFLPGINQLFYRARVY